MLDERLLNQIAEERNQSPATKKQYKYAVKTYTRYCKKPMYKLIEEAEKEEEKGIRWKNRKLRKRLLGFRAYLSEEYPNLTTAKKKLQLIKAIYKHFEIELYPLPPISTKGFEPENVVKFSDLPDKEIIKEALKISSPLMRAIILFMSSSGCARKETLNLTIGSLIDSLKDYTDKTDIYEIIHDLKDKEDIVPTFNMVRQKTNKRYYTFCSPEAVNAIFSYLESENRYLKREFPLFKIGESYLILQFNQINDSLNLGKVGNFNRFRSHMLRKFHASQLYNGIDGLSMDEIDSLQGRKKTNVHTAYFFDDPEKLRQKYINSMDKLLINADVVTIDSPEVLQLKKNALKLEEENLEIKANIDRHVEDKIQEVLKKYGF